MKSNAGAVARYLFLDLAGSLIHFPFWWYTKGFFDVLQWVGRSCSFQWKSYGITLWMKNFFVPMYGQYDFSGRLVSVIMRFVVLIGRLIVFVVFALAYLLAVVAWLVIPIVALLLFLHSLYQGAFGLPPLELPL
ncbi:hypothetical protein FJZ48_03770 [Candidatus Uhrbacteria bacterium]|nr:hypothetical protein [Candidatus Uhrbacteria bacterium]